MGIAHTLGGLLGGAMIAGVAWLLGAPIKTLLGNSGTKLAVTLVFALACAVDFGFLRWRDRRGQANPEWRVRLGHVRSYFLYGFLFGSGWLATKPSAVYYAVLALAAWRLPAGYALAAGASFGLGRTILVYPASFRATRVSLVISRGRYSYRTMRTLGALLTLTMLATLWGVV